MLTKCSDSRFHILIDNRFDRDARKKIDLVCNGISKDSTVSAKHPQDYEKNHLVKTDFRFLHYNFVLAQRVVDNKTRGILFSLSFNFRVS